jgi:hypothetical protein
MAGGNSSQLSTNVKEMLSIVVLYNSESTPVQLYNATRVALQWCLSRHLC